MRSAARRRAYKLLGQRRLAHEIIGAAVQRLDQRALIVLGGHQKDVDRATAVGEQPDFPAQLEARHMLQVCAGDDGLDAAIRLDALERGALVAELHDLMPTCLKQTGHDQPRGPARIN